MWKKKGINIVLSNSYLDYHKTSIKLRGRISVKKYISIFFLLILTSIILFFSFAPVFMGGGNPAEEAVMLVGSIIIALLSFLITQMFYLIDFLKKRM
jgi:uncharacterized membrane protein (DUF485 family)